MVKRVADPSAGEMAEGEIQARQPLATGQHCDRFVSLYMEKCLI